MSYTENQRTRLHTARSFAGKAEEIVEEVYREILGKLMVDEVEKY